MKGSGKAPAEWFGSAALSLWAVRLLADKSAGRKVALRLGAAAMADPKLRAHVAWWSKRSARGLRLSVAAPLVRLGPPGTPYPPMIAVDDDRKLDGRVDDQGE